MEDNRTFQDFAFNESPHAVSANYRIHVLGFFKIIFHIHKLYYRFEFPVAFTSKASFTLML